MTIVDVANALLDEFGLKGHMHEWKRNPKYPKDDVILQALIRLDPNHLSPDDLKKIEARRFGGITGSEEAFAEIARDIYKEKSGGEPTLDAFIRNANLALWHIQESPQYQPLLEQTKQYIALLQSLSLQQKAQQ